MSEKKQQSVSRRQFLNYTLMGVGGFLVAGVTAPMLGFAIDPALKPRQERDMVAVGNIDDFSSEPKRVDFRLPVQDGWANYDISLSAWVTRLEGDKVLALSPICKHLGCTVTWGSDKAPTDHFYCPCHDGLYTKNGVNVPGTPPNAALDVYQYKVEEDGTLYLGNAVPREEL
jgi:menaquinol-cytochrome c reductase iron-sulfur subunit